MANAAVKPPETMGRWHLAIPSSESERWPAVDERNTTTPSSSHIYTAIQRRCILYRIYIMTPVFLIYGNQHPTHPLKKMAVSALEDARARSIHSRTFIMRVLWIFVGGK